MSKVGISIDESSRSDISCSDLSCSESDTSLDSVEIPPLPPTRFISMSLDDVDEPPSDDNQQCGYRRPNLASNRSISMPDIMNIDRRSLSPKRGAGYRSRVRRRLEELELSSFAAIAAAEAAAEDGSEEDRCNPKGMGVSRHRHSRLRFYFAICSLCFVTFTMNSANTVSRSITSEIRRDEVNFPLHQHHPRNLSSGDKEQIRAELPKYYFPKIEPVASSPAGLASTANNADGNVPAAGNRPKIRTNIAMARSGPESRPIFEPKDRFMMLDETTSKFHIDRREPIQEGLALSTWIIGVAVFFGLIEMGYTKYRTCQTAHDESRRR